MTMTPFTAGWTVRAADSDVATPVSLPHDAMISEKRSATEATGSHGAYFPGGRYIYATKWLAPADAADRELSLFFEGVYGDTQVRVNGETVGHSISGYREFAVPLNEAIVAGTDNLIEVEVDNSAVPNSRWYTGSGIYRRVWLEDVRPTHLLRDGISLVTRSIDGPAIVQVDIDVQNPDEAPLTVAVTLTDSEGTRTTAESAVIGAHASLELRVDDPRLWSDSTPHLYTARVELAHGGELVDSREIRVGLRTVDVDAEHGLRVNGESVLLRGACVHHDSGVLGAATFRAAEFRRARILKDNGFNAVRSSHNPLSRDLLDACDEYGLYVLDELTDVWFAPKSAHDFADRFDEVWPDDARAMVAKDRNHASVIMYSIGNEIAETGTPQGVAAAHDIANFVRALDPHRPTTLALNFLLNVMASSGRSMFDTSDHDPDTAERKPSAVTSTMANVLANRVGGMMQVVAKLPKASVVSRDVFEAVEVAGYNYAWGRYVGDAKRYPKRVMLGSETMPGDIPKIWALVEKLPSLIGDFVWTGWDYLGETGIGTWSYGDAPAAIAKPFPELLAGCGLIDITGHPGAAMLLARATWGQLDSPQIAVRPLDRAGEKVRRVAWRSTDAVQSWAWAGSEAKLAEVEVYSSDDTVELLLNGRSLGRKAAGKRRGFVTRYRVPYEAGELVAVGYRDGVEVSRSALRSAGAARVRVTVEPDGGSSDDVAFVRIELADDEGVVEMLASDTVTVTVSGPATLAGLGSGNPSTVESFADAEHTTWYGRALAVIRPTGQPGDIEVTVTSETHGSASVVVPAGRALHSSV